MGCISIHALREEGDLRRSSSRPVPCNFYPRPPRGGRLHHHAGGEPQQIFLSTPSARRATSKAGGRQRLFDISIHALREEGDPAGSLRINHPPDFYPRPPRGGRRCQPRPGSRPDQFLSTPSARRATRGMRRGSPDLRNFYPRPPRGGRRVVSERLTPVSYFYPRPPRGGRRSRRCRCCRSRPISIHALREEGDGAALPSAECLEDISIHALREEGDSGWRPRPPWRCNFYPRPPRGGRLSRIGTLLGGETFLSTPSARRATVSCCTRRGVMSFLSTPSARRATIKSIKEGDKHEFLSTPSARRATDHRPDLRLRRAISIHALREEGDATRPSPSTG